MKNKYLLIFHNKYTDAIQNMYFTTKEDMKDFIRVNLSQKRYFKVLHKYEIKEIR